MAERIAQKAQQNTLYNGLRPYGTSVIFGCHDPMKGFSLYLVEPSGTVYEYYGCASGRGKQLARNEIEKKNFREMSV